jgi:hypothetical protein
MKSPRAGNVPSLLLKNILTLMKMRLPNGARYTPKGPTSSLKTCVNFLEMQFPYLCHLNCYMTKMNIARAVIQWQSSCLPSKGPVFNTYPTTSQGQRTEGQAYRFREMFNGKA